MKLEKRQPSGREKDEAAVQLLDKLREQLYSSNLTVVRQSAFNLSWLQEDGLDVLREALFSDASKRTKGAASYGLRKMRGRMAKVAVQVLKEGAESSSSSTAQVCQNALSVLENPKAAAKRAADARRRSTRFEIRDIGPASRRKPGMGARPKKFFRPSSRS